MTHLAYPFSVRPLAPDEGGGYLVEFPDLPGCLADGETVEEAIEHAREAMEAWISDVQDSGEAVPSPSSHEAYSGRWLQRVPRSLHAKLVARARAEGVSLNSFITSVLAEAVGIRLREQVRGHRDATNREGVADVPVSSERRSAPTTAPIVVEPSFDDDAFKSEVDDCFSALVRQIKILAKQMHEIAHSTSGSEWPPLRSSILDSMKGADSSSPRKPTSMDAWGRWAVDSRNPIGESKNLLIWLDSRTSQAKEPTRKATDTILCLGLPLVIGDRK